MITAVREKVLRRLKRVGFWLGATAAGVLLAWSSVAPHLIDPARFAVPAGSLTITDRHGVPLRHVRVNDHHRRWTEIDDVSPLFLEAMLVAEDARYFEHHGVDLAATVRAIGYAAAPTRRRSGASTITQQTVKLTYGRPLGLWSKPLEILRALALEQRMDKLAILEQYVNRLPYADNITGIARASESYFGKTPDALTLSEAAMLAGLPQAPTRYDPRRHYGAAIERRDIVLRRMYRLKRIDARSLRDAMASRPVVLAEARPWRAPRFADRVLGAYRHGDIAAGPQRTLASSLDAALHEEVRDVLRASVDRFADRGVTNGAAIVVHNASGEIRAYVGAARPDGPGGAIDLLRARRQPGSALKPFVYELLFERGGTAATVLDDVATPMTGGAGELFEAEDYDGRERGPVRARAALAASLNLAAIDAARRVGARRVVDRLRSLGLELGGAERYGAAIALGGADVAPLEMAQLYVALARGGTRVPLMTREVGSREGDAIMDPMAAALTVDVLTDAAARRDGFGEDLVDLAGRDFGLKTGTSSGFRDVWAAAFTEEVTVVVWMGDPEGRPLDGVSGFAAAAPTAARLIALADPEDTRSPNTDFVVAPVCALSGRRPGPGCAHVATERFVPGTAPRHICAFHQPDGSVVLPARFSAWQRRVQLAGTRVAELSETNGRLRIVRPRDGDRLIVDPRRPPAISLRATLGGSFAEGARWTIDGAPTTGSWTPTPGEHVVDAWLGDRHARATVTVR